MDQTEVTLPAPIGIYMIYEWIQTFICAKINNWLRKLQDLIFLVQGLGYFTSARSWQVQGKRNKGQDRSNVIECKQSKVNNCKNIKEKAQTDLRPLTYLLLSSLVTCHRCIHVMWFFLWKRFVVTKWNSRGLWARLSVEDNTKSVGRNNLTVE